nr:hypothetical protein [Tanacetum cinerariifolium]
DRNNGSRNKDIATVDCKPQTISESSLRRHLKLNGKEWISSFPNAGRLTKRAIWIAQSKALSPDADEPASLSRDDRHGEAFPTSKALSPDADEPASLSRDDRHGKAFPTVSSLDAGLRGKTLLRPLPCPMNHHQGLQRQQSQMANKIKDQRIEISRLKARVKFLDDKDRRRDAPIQEDAIITGGIIDIEEEFRADKSTEKGSNDTKEMVNVLSSMEATYILSSGGATVSVSPAAIFPIAGVPTISGSFSTPMRIPIISAKDKGKEKVIETEVPKKKKLQEQIDARAAKEMEEKSNEVIAKRLSEYEQAKANLHVGEKIELISELVKYQDHRVKILKYQA